MGEPLNLVPMGYLAGPFGLKGWVKIKVSTESSASLANYREVYLQLNNAEWQLKQIESGFARDGIFHAKLTGVNDRDAAAAMQGATLAVAREQFPVPAVDEYYWVDLIGLAVLNLDNAYLGQVVDLMETGANDVLVVDQNGKQRLIPFVKQYVTNVNLQLKQIIVAWGVDY